MAMLFNRKINNFLSEVDAISKKLQEDNEYLDSDQLSRFKQSINSLEVALKEEEKKNNLLRIGIIGSVKAGKSTFLNALLFNGERILPKAPTPMTASLTRLRYSNKDEQSVRFVFYSKEDWAKIEEEALVANEEIQRKFEKKQQNRKAGHLFNAKAEKRKLREQLSEARRACIELIETTEKSGVDLSLLGQDKKVIFSSLLEVSKIFEEYIGSNGSLTTIVSYVELNLHHDFLKNLEIVDTPGLNDPVVSRSEETLKSLSQCDSVFLLSRASQFLEESDLRMLSDRTLYQEGIRHKKVIATQMDLAAFDHHPKKVTFDQAYKITGKNVFDRQRTIKNIILDKPVPISAMLLACAYKIENNISLDDEEKKVLNQIQNYKGHPTTPSEYRKYANIGAAKKAINEVRHKKEEIKKVRQQDLVLGKANILVEILSNLEKVAKSNSRLLRDQDIETLKKRQQSISDALESVHVRLSSLFLKSETQMKEQMEHLKNRIISDIEGFDNLNVETRITHHEKESTSGMLFWEKKYYRTIEETNYVANVADAVSLVRKYMADQVKHINQTFKEILSIEQLKDQVKTRILSLYTSNNIDFDEETILLPLESTLGKLKVPNFEFDNNELNNKLIESFNSAEVKNEEISQLKLVLEQVLQEAGKKLTKKLSEHQRDISNKLTYFSTDFTKEVTKKIDSQLNIIISHMEYKEKNLKKYRQIIENLHKYRMLISSLKVDNV